MIRVVAYSLMLALGIVLSQVFGGLPFPTHYPFQVAVNFITIVCLGFLVIRLGLEVSLNYKNLRQYKTDAVVAFLSASFPWLLCAFYFVYAFDHAPTISNRDIWKESLFLSRFAAPTSLGVLVAMLGVAKFKTSWLGRKLRTLVILDDIDTIILMIPLKKMMLKGLGIDTFLTVAMLGAIGWLGWKRSRAYRLPLRWPWLLAYALLLTLGTEFIYYWTTATPSVTLHIEVIFPAFVLGAVIAYPRGGFDTLHAIHDEVGEKRATTVITCLFMLFAGMLMPPLIPDGTHCLTELMLGVDAPDCNSIWNWKFGSMHLSTLLYHVTIVSILITMGKMVPIFFYREEASFGDRFALAMGMCPRGELGTGLLVVSLSLLTVVENSILTVAALSLAVNILLTGPFVLAVRNRLKVG